MATVAPPQPPHAPAEMQPSLVPETAEAADAVEHAAAEALVAPAVVPEPVYIAPAPVRKPVTAAKEKGGMSVGVIAGAAVAAVTLIAAGVGIMKSGGKKGEKSAQKPAATRPAASSKSASRSSSSRTATARWVQDTGQLSHSFDYVARTCVQFDVATIVINVLLQLDCAQCMHCC